MNRSRHQTKAAKARKEWQRLQEQKLKEEQEGLTENLKKVAEVKKRKSLRHTG